MYAFMSIYLFRNTIGCVLLYVVIAVNVVYQRAMLLLLITSTV